MLYKWRPLVGFTGHDSDRVSGTVFAVTPNELQNVDEYEVAPIKRVVLDLQSGVCAWVYVDARSAPPVRSPAAEA